MISPDMRRQIADVNTDLLTAWCSLEKLRGETGDDVSDAEITKAMRSLDAANNALLRAEFPDVKL